MNKFAFNRWHTSRNSLKVNGVYAAVSKNCKTRFCSSSGGIFYEMGCHVLKNGGVVFGVVFDEKWGVKNTYATNKRALKKMMTSKYVISNVNGVYSEVSRFLNDNKIVLFAGTPCQIFGLKHFLKKNYSNLVCVDLVCHGVMPASIWEKYLLSLKKDNCDIIGINFRDKSNGWENYNFRVDYSDGTSIIQNHKDNFYMKTFLSDKYLLPSCYNCKFKNESSLADITIGDFWSINLVDKKINDDMGISSIYIKTNSGLDFVRSIKNLRFRVSEKKLACQWNGGWKEGVDAEKEKFNYNSIPQQIKKVGIITLTLHENIGGILQCFALSKAIEKLGYEAIVNQIPIKTSKPCLPFVNEHLKLRIIPNIKNALSRIEYNDYQAFVIGSDQIWRSGWILDFKGTFLNFANSWNVKRIAYAPSFGINYWAFDKYETAFMAEQLRKFDAISVREINGAQLCKDNLGFQPNVVVDPTMLFDKKFYLSFCKDVPRKKGFFSYILDETTSINKYLKCISDKFSLDNIMINNNNIEEWLAAFRDAEFIITDSYHGCIFSLLFNKPFVCIYNKERGGTRFDTLSSNYNIENRIFDSVNSINIDMLNVSPNKLDKIKKLSKESWCFITQALKDDQFSFVRTNSAKRKIKLFFKILLPKNSILGGLSRKAYKHMRKS